MKTIPELLTQQNKDPLWMLYFRRFMDDFWCFFLGHNWHGFSGGGESWRDWDEVCRRCYRRKNTGGFHHNWEMDRGPVARCHDHSKLLK